jgi:hypothetical protein
MKEKFLISVGIMLCLYLGACASKPQKGADKPICAEWIKPDSAAYNKLGKRLATVLFAPQSVKCYHLIGKEKVEKGDVEIDKNFVRDTLLATLKPGEIAVLQYSLLKPAKSYRKNSVVVMSPYMPILEFEFTKKKEKAHVVISLSDVSWTIFYDDKKQFNYNYANEDLVAQFCNYYVSLYYSRKK